MSERREYLEDLVSSHKKDYEGKYFDEISEDLYGFWKGSERELFTDDVKAYGQLAGGGPSAWIGFFHNGYCEVVACWSGDIARVSFYMDFEITDYLEYAT